MQTYNGGLTREQFLLYEIRIVARLVCQGLERDQIIQKLKEENLFQFPTERMIENIANVCFKRLDALTNADLVLALATAPAEVAKQINLYAMMRYNRVAWDFMVTVIGEKYRTQDYSFQNSDLTLFFLRLQEQNDAVAGWSEGTIQKIKQVLKKALVECNFLDSTKATQLNPVYPHEELVDGIQKNGDTDALSAFNYFDSY